MKYRDLFIKPKPVMAMISACLEKCEGKFLSADAIWYNDPEGICLIFDYDKVGPETRK